MTLYVSDCCLKNNNIVYAVNLINYEKFNFCCKAALQKPIVLVAMLIKFGSIFIQFSSITL